MIEQDPEVSGDVEVARWTHLWMCAAFRSWRHLEELWDDESPASALGARDALALVVVDAVRNVYRGAVAVLGTAHEAVLAFNESQITLKSVRDRFEHFEDYVRGRGHAQRTGNRNLELEGVTGLYIRGSSGGGPGGHTVEVIVQERGGEKVYTVETSAAIDAARALVRVVLSESGLGDDRHDAACEVCFPGTGA